MCIDIDYHLIDEIIDFLGLEEDFKDLSFEQRKEILKFHNEMVANQHQKEQSDYQFEMNGLLAMINSRLNDISNRV